METSEELFYTENSEYTDEDVEMIMAMHHPTVIINKENLNWQDEASEITVGYADVDTHGDADDTLTESEVYLSTNADDSVDNDKSQYYSILDSTYQSDGEEFVPNVSTEMMVKMGDTSESILPDMAENDDYDMQESEIVKEDADSLNNQVVLFHSDNPNEMYAVQVADDGSGNLQKYKYKVR